MSLPARAVDGTRLSCTTCLATFRGAFQRCPRDGAPLAAAPTDPLLGVTLGGRYVIEALLGEGGLGRVYRARHVKLSRRYAVKVPFGDVAGDDRLRRRFAQEAEAASRLGHPNLVGVLDVGESESGLLYLVMDLVDGESLGRVIAGGPLPAAQAATITEQIAAGLGHAHDRDLIHRDLKPDNVLVATTDDGPVARIVDFGIAIFRDDEHSRVTTQGIVMGTPHYMAPEQATADKLDARTDLFALGVILYELLAGVLPFDGAAIDIARQHLTVEPPAIGVRVPGLTVDPLLERLAFWLMAKRRDERPATAAAVVDWLRLYRSDPAAAEAALPSGAGTEAPSATGEPDGPRFARDLAAPATTASFETLPTVPEGVSAARLRGRRRGALLALAGALAAAGVAVVLVAVRHRDRAARPRPTADSMAGSMAGSTVAAPTPAPAPVVITSLEPTAPAPDGPGSADERAQPTGTNRPATSERPDRKPARPGDRATAGPGSTTGAPMTTPAATPTPKPTESPAPTPPSPAGAGSSAPPPAPKVDPTELKRLYASVGERLNRAFSDGDPRASDLRARYTALPFLQALRDPEQAARVERELRALAGELSRP